MSEFSRSPLRLSSRFDWPARTGADLDVRGRPRGRAGRGTTAWRAYVAVVAVLTVIGLLGPIGCATSGAAAGATTTTTVTRVIDGDTIVVAAAGGDTHDDHVRLIGIDTPETKKPNTPVECFGPEATARLHELLPPGTAVQLVRDAEATDTYGRALAYVYRSDDGLFINEAQVTDGFAAPLTIPPNVAHAEAFAAAAAQARTEGRGLWGACAGTHTTKRIGRDPG